MARRASFLFLLLTLVTVGWLRAQEEPPSTPVRLTDLLQQALQKNLDYREARLQPDTYVSAILRESAPFQPQFSTSFNSSRDKTPTSSVLAGAETLIQKRNTVSLSLSQRISWGTEISAQLDQSKWDTNNTFATLNPRYNTSLTLSLRQPLLRGFGPWNAQANLRAAEHRLEGSKYNLTEAEMDLLVQVAQAYWDLAYAHKNYQVQVNSLKLARKVVRDTVRRIEVGVLAPIEKVSAEAEVALRQQNVVTALTQIQAATDRLKSLVETTEAMMVRPGEIWVPQDEPPEPGTIPSLSELIGLALKNRAIVRAAQEEVRAAEIQANAARNQRLPQLDLVANYTWTGLGGDRIIFGGSFFNRRIIEVIEGEFTDSLNQVLRGQFPSWTIGLQLVWPLNNTAAQAAILEAERQLDLARIRFERARQQVVLQVRNAYRDLVAARQRYEAAKASVELQRTNLDAEQKRLEIGMSTNFVVLQYQNNLTQAESQLFLAQTDYAKAMIAMLRAIGKLTPENVMQVRLLADN